MFCSYYILPTQTVEPPQDSAIFHIGLSYSWTLKSYPVYMMDPHTIRIRIGFFFLLVREVARIIIIGSVIVQIETTSSISTPGRMVIDRSESDPFLYIWPGSDIDALCRIRLDWTKPDRTRLQRNRSGRHPAFVFRAGWSLTNPKRIRFLHLARFLYRCVILRNMNNVKWVVCFGIISFCQSSTFLVTENQNVLLEISSFCLLLFAWCVWFFVFVSC